MYLSFFLFWLTKLICQQKWQLFEEILYTHGHRRSFWDLTWPLVIGSLKMLIPGVNRAIEICERLMFLVRCVVFRLSALWSVEAWEHVDWSSRVPSCSLSFIQRRRQKRQETNAMDKSGSEPNLHLMINDPPLSAHLTLSLSRVKWAEDNNKQSETKLSALFTPAHLSPDQRKVHIHTHTQSERPLNASSLKMEALISRLKVNFQ